MITIKRFNSHDSLAFKMIEGKTNIRLGWSRYRDTASASPSLGQVTLNRAMKAWTKIRNSNSADTMGQRLDNVIKAVENSPTIEHAVDTLENLANSTYAVASPNPM